jgi:hypothetical protein
MLAVFSALLASLSNRNTSIPEVRLGAGPYRTPGVPAGGPCPECGPLEAAGLRAYMQASASARASANELLICACGRSCGVRLRPGAEA